MTHFNLHHYNHYKCPTNKFLCKLVICWKYFIFWAFSKFSILETSIKLPKRQNYRKGRHTFLRKLQKVKNEVTWTEKRRFWFIHLKMFNKFTFLGSVLTFLQFSYDARDYIGPFGNSVFYEIFSSSNF